MNRIRLHAIVILIITAGCIWVLISQMGQLGYYEARLCLFKKTTGIPCPSCGTTRSVSALLNGELLSAVWWNPFGIILSAAMIVFPLWILSDRLRGKDSFYHFYKTTENILRQRMAAITAISLVVANWIWGIVKFL